jgi:hypothetical protein
MASPDRFQGRSQCTSRPTSAPRTAPARTACPSFYSTDDGRYIVQGYKLTSAQARAQLVNFPDGEDAVIITKDLADLIVAHHTGTKQ